MMNTSRLFTVMHFPLYPVGKPDGAEFFSMLVEQYYYIAGLQGFGMASAFLSFCCSMLRLLVFFRFRYHLHIERNIVLVRST